MPQGDSVRACSKCKRDLPIEHFGFKDKASGTRHSRCKDCIRAYSQAHYRENARVYIDRAKESNRALRERKRGLVADLRSQACADCGRSFPPCCMQFDHRSGREVTGRNSPEAIANMKNSPGSLTQLVEEIAKCDVVCANCHCIRTASRSEK